MYHCLARRLRRLPASSSSSCRAPVPSEDPLDERAEGSASSRQQVDAEENRRQDDHHDGRGLHLALRRPGHPPDLRAHLAEEVLRALSHHPSGFAEQAVSSLATPTCASLTLSTIAVFTVRFLQCRRPGATRGCRDGRASTGEFGRPGGTRTPSPRFWRPVLCQLSYWPVQRPPPRLLASRDAACATCSSCRTSSSSGARSSSSCCVVVTVVATLALAARELNDVSLRMMISAPSRPYASTDAEPETQLLQNLADRAGADRAAAFADREPQALLQRHRRRSARSPSSRCRPASPSPRLPAGAPRPSRPSSGCRTAADSR